MIKGIGIDICSTKRIDKILNKKNSNFIESSFSSHEIEESNKYKNPSQFFTSRFAAKEAFLKSLGLGVFNDKISLNEISIEKETNGKPFIKVQNESIKNELKNSKIYLSISHELDMCSAFFKFSHSCDNAWARRRLA